jgi:aconitate hydratase
MDPETYRRMYADLANATPMWGQVESPSGARYTWDTASTYIQEPPYFDGFGADLPATPGLKGARALAMFGDSITTDHISPAGAIKETSPAGRYLKGRGVGKVDFNSYGARRGSHDVMVRGTFANVRIKNLMVPGVEGGVTVHQPSGDKMDIYDAAERYQAEGTPLFIMAGQEYGTGSSRDWAAKGTRLLGVRAVFARSFERIHRSNLVGMGVLPCQFQDGTTVETLGLKGDETLDLVGVEDGIKPQMDLTLVIRRADGGESRVPVRLRIDTPIEVQYYRHGGILPYVLRQIVARAA